MYYSYIREEHRYSLMILEKCKEIIKMNILILSAGTRNKIVQYFKKTLEGKGNVICTDMSELAPSIYEADKHYIVPRMTAPGYLEAILDICKKEKIDGVLSLIDPELSLLAKMKISLLL